MIDLVSFLEGARDILNVLAGRSNWELMGDNTLKARGLEASKNIPDSEPIEPDKVADHLEVTVQTSSEAISEARSLLYGYRKMQVVKAIEALERVTETVDNVHIEEAMKMLKVKE